MRIGINTAFLSQPLTGSGQYTAQLLRALAEVDDANEYQLFSYAPAASSLSLPPRFSHPRLLGSPAAGSGENAQKAWYEQVALPWAAQGHRLDLLHYPYFAGPLRCPVPVVMTVHDLVPLLFREYRSSLLAGLYTALVAAAARRAKTLIADSQCTKRDIVEHLRVPAERVQVIYLAADERFRPVADAGALAAIRRQYGLADRFLLYLGGLDRRKGVDLLLRALASLKAQGVRGLQLAIGGELRPPSPLFPDLPRLAQGLGLKDEVVFLGLVPEEDKLLLYNAAAALVYPSLYEGFGLPPLEAMACGVPVVCSSAASLPEVVGDAALLVKPGCEEGLAAALERLWGDPSLQEELRERGLARARHFSWRRTAEQTLGVYRQACAS